MRRTRGRKVKDTNGRRRDPQPWSPYTGDGELWAQEPELFDEDYGIDDYEWVERSRPRRRH
ncbi:MAG: hypothetical protein KJO07_03990 [Deltaproteobacteria bacterium]|nr:hypothetical protein [Deltaproteobacteria bacterium]